MTTIKDLKEIARENKDYFQNQEIFRQIIDHSVDVAEKTKKLAIARGYSQKIVIRLEEAALLHDVGKLWLPISDLTNKSKYYPANNQMRAKHVDKGREIAELKKFNILTTNVIKYHHESYDKPEWGYPGELHGEDIPELVRLVTVADAFCAMGEDRPYRLGMSLEKIKTFMTNHNHEKYDPEIVQFFFDKIINVDSLNSTNQDISEAYYS